jgi:phenylpyruvate tautomerase PptA (4-oxalocrotonate tautomerase family)
MPIVDVERVLADGVDAAAAAYAEGDALQAHVTALTQAIADVLGCDASCVHVQLAPAGAGRQAFGGRVVS